jgi:hypothetical protein
MIIKPFKVINILVALTMATVASPLFAKQTRADSLSLQRDLEGVMNSLEKVPSK